MLAAALYELLDERERALFLTKMNALGLPGVRVEAERAEKCGIVGTHIKVTVSGAEEDEALGSAHGDAGVHNYSHDAASEHSHSDASVHGHSHDDASMHSDSHDAVSEHSHGDASAHSHSSQHDAVSEHSHGDISVYGDTHDAASVHVHSHDDVSLNSHRDVCAHSHGDVHAHSHSHSALPDIARLIASLPLSAQVRRHAAAVYEQIAEAESRVHGVPVTAVHFHEVGAMDAVADVTAVCLLMEMLDVGSVSVSPVHVGSGSVRCAHGVLPVPAPATAFLLRGVPIYGGSVKGELCTPTGAALLRYFADDFGEMPLMRTERIGYGMGKRDFAAANCVRAMLGEPYKKAVRRLQGDAFSSITERPQDEAADCLTRYSQGDASDSMAERPQDETGKELARHPQGEVPDAALPSDEHRIIELSCNVDDMTAERIGFAMERLFEAGALEVYTIPVGMKKSRPGVMLCVMCPEERKEEMVRAIFRHTATLGVREAALRRYTLDRRVEKRATDFGEVRVKCAEGFGVRREKYEYEDLARLARERGLSIEEVLRRIEAAQ